MKADDDAPLGKCPEHPDKNAWRSCTRCGRFLCAVCTYPTPKGPLCEACKQLQTETTPDSFKPMMVLPFLGLITWVYFSLTYGVADARLAFELLKLGDSGAWFQGSMVVINALMCLAALALIFRFALRKRGVPRQMVWFNSASLSLRIVSVAVDWEGIPRATLMTHLVSAMVLIMFIFYFRFSDEPARTFVR